MTPEELRSLTDEATPGPWFWDSYAGVHHSGEDMESDEYVPVAKVNTGYDGSRWREDGKANARLIALAPDLAQLCAEMGEALQGIVEDDWDLSDAVDRAAPVLAKLSELKP